jgi:hypothetical protein
MPHNPIRFQPGICLDSFFARDGTEHQRAAAVEAARWQQGFVCPHAGARARSRFHADARVLAVCAVPGADLTDLPDAFESSRAALTTWF